MNRSISNCPLCEERSLHIIGDVNEQTLQCINCGYASSHHFLLCGIKKDELEHYNNLTDDMKKWSKETDTRIWIPSIITLPFGILCPVDDEDGNMKWSLSKMTEIPEDKRKDYPREDGNGYYSKQYDTDNSELFDTFLEALARMDQIASSIKQSDKSNETSDGGHFKVNIPKSN